MNDPSVHDVLVGSLDRHARAVGSPAGDLIDVLRRVDRRRARRRSTAVIGSTLAVAAGAAGIMLVAAPADAPAPGDGDPDATGAAGSWGCSGFLASDGTADYYATCRPFPDVVRPTAPILAPATSLMKGPPPTMITEPPVPTTGPSPMSTIPPATAGTTNGFAHVVVEGDSISGIADMYGIRPLDLVEVNGWPDGVEHPLQIGDVVAIPWAAVTTLPPVTAVAVDSSPPVCESSADEVRVTVPCVPVTAGSPMPTTATLTSPSVPAAAYRCTGPLGGDLSDAYYSSCEQVPWDAVPNADRLVPTTMAFTPVFATTVPLLSAPATFPPTTTAPPTPEGSCQTPTTAVGDISEVEQTYTVVAGDSISGIAELYGIDACILVAYNSWPDGIEHPLFIGDVVRIPPDSRIP